MGMFDTVELSIKCPECGSVISDFQSKDGECMCSTIDYWEVDNFHSPCGHCGAWIQFTLKEERETPPIPLSKYQCFVTKPGKDLYDNDATKIYEGTIEIVETTQKNKELREGL